MIWPWIAGAAVVWLLTRDDSSAPVQSLVVRSPAVPGYNESAVAVDKQRGVVETPSTPDAVNAAHAFADLPNPWNEQAPTVYAGTDPGNMRLMAAFLGQAADRCPIPAACTAASYWLRKRADELDSRAAQSMVPQSAIDVQRQRGDISATPGIAPLFPVDTSGSFAPSVGGCSSECTSCAPCRIRKGLPY